MYKVYVKKVSGYFTVEAAMLMPMVLLLIMFLFYITFYMYDRCVISQDVYLLAFRGSLYCDMKKEEIQQSIENQCRETYGNKYIGVERLDSQVKAENKVISVEASGYMNMTNWKLQAKAEAERICPVECIRKWRLIQKIGNEFITE